MTIKAAGLLRHVEQMWVHYGACKDDRDAKRILKSAHKASEALRNYIQEIERAGDTKE